MGLISALILWPWQAFAMLLLLRTVEVATDAPGHALVLHAVTPTGGMTSDYYPSHRSS